MASGTACLSGAPHLNMSSLTSISETSLMLYCGITYRKAGDNDADDDDGEQSHAVYDIDEQSHGDDANQFLEPIDPLRRAEPTH